MTEVKISWLLRTIEDPKTAKRLVQAQYERGRISYQMIVDLARRHGWTDYATVQLLTLPLLRSTTHCIARHSDCRGAIS